MKKLQYKINHEAGIKKKTENNYTQREIKKDTNIGGKIIERTNMGHRDIDDSDVTKYVGVHK